MELELEQPLSTTLSVKVSADIEPRLDHHCARLRPSGTLSRAALVRSLLNAGLKQLDEEEQRLSTPTVRPPYSTSLIPQEQGE